MKIYLDCIPCFLRQALEAARMAGNDERVHRKVLNAVMNRLTGLELDVTPPQVGQAVHRTIRELTFNNDPYREIKARYNEIALDMLPRLKAIIRQAEDPLLIASKIAIAGNIIDFAAFSGEIDLDNVLSETLHADFALDDYAAFREAILRATRIVYLGDNAGEIVFDCVLIEEMLRIGKAKIAFVVRGKPVINDATLEDAKLVGLDRLVEVISNGSDAPATVLSECTPEMIDAYRSADLVVAKGQGNYESLSEETGRLFFLLKAKCPVIARDLGVRVGGTILKRAGA
jgi:damage-control phosphatase, subfamily I